MSASAWADRKLHFIAIGGAGMSGLALVCDRLGARVTGSDRAESSYLRRVLAAGIDARVGHDPARVPEDAEVVVSTAVPETNPELSRALAESGNLTAAGVLANFRGILPRAPDDERAFRPRSTH